MKTLKYIASIIIGALIGYGMILLADVIMPIWENTTLIHS